MERIIYSIEEIKGNIKGSGKVVFVDKRKVGENERDKL